MIRRSTTLGFASPARLTTRPMIFTLSPVLRVPRAAPSRPARPASAFPPEGAEAPALPAPAAQALDEVLVRAVRAGYQAAPAEGVSESVAAVAAASERDWDPRA